MKTAEASFVRMCRAFPVRTALFTLGPILIGLGQVCNVALNGGTVWLAIAIAMLTGVFAGLATSYHLAAFRRRTLMTDLE